MSKICPTTANAPTFHFQYACFFLNSVFHKIKYIVLISSLNPRPPVFKVELIITLFLKIVGFFFTYPGDFLQLFKEQRYEFQLVQYVKSAYRLTPAPLPSLAKPSSPTILRVRVPIETNGYFCAPTAPFFVVCTRPMLF